MVPKRENKTKKICGYKNLVICGFFCFILFTIFIIVVKYISQLIVEKLNCGKQLKLEFNTKVYIQDRLENVFENFCIVEDNVVHEQVQYAILRVDIPFLYKYINNGIDTFRIYTEIVDGIDANIVKVEASVDANKEEVFEGKYKIFGHKIASAATKAPAAPKAAAPKATEATATEATATEATEATATEATATEATATDKTLRESLQSEQQELTDIEILKKKIKDEPTNRKLQSELNELMVNLIEKQRINNKLLITYQNGLPFIAVPKSYVHRLDSLNACLIGNDPLKLFGGGEDKKGEKAEMFRKWKNGEKTLQDMKWYDNIPFLAESKMSVQINYFIYKLFVPINRIGCYLQQLNFNRIENICKVFTCLDEAIFFPFLFIPDREKKKARDIAELEKQKIGKSSEDKTKIENSINTLKAKNDKTDNSSLFDAIKHVLETFFNFSMIFLQKVTLTIFSIIVNYMTLMIDII